MKLTSCRNATLEGEQPMSSFSFPEDEFLITCKMNPSIPVVTRCDLLKTLHFRPSTCKNERVLKQLVILLEAGV